jgi:hypothetical protein
MHKLKGSLRFEDARLADAAVFQDFGQIVSRGDPTRESFATRGENIRIFNNIGFVGFR